MNKLAYLLLFLGIITLAVFAADGEEASETGDTGDDDNNGETTEDDNGTDSGVVNMGGDIRLALAMGVGAYIFGNFLV